MTAKAFQKRLTGAASDFLNRFRTVMGERKIDSCVIGGLTVNADTAPPVTLDGTVVAVPARLPALVALVPEEIRQRLR